MIFDSIITEYDKYFSYYIICLFAFVSTTYLYYKILCYKCTKIQLVYLFVCGNTISIMFSVLKDYNSQLSNIVMCLAIPVSLSFLFKTYQTKWSENYAVAMMSLSIFQVVKVMSTIIVGSFFWLMGIPKENILVYLINMVLAFAICFLFVHIKRFRRGIQFFSNERNIGLGLAISGIIFMITCLELRSYNEMDIVFIIVILGAIICGFGLYLWIRRSITAHYRERMKLRSEEHYKEVLEERNEEIKKLNQSNEYLAKIVHRDNHLMSALDSSIDAYFNSADETDKDTLLRELQTLAKERGELIAKEQLESKILPSTGNHLIDGAISDLYIKAAAHGIDFDLTVSSTVDEIIGKYISQTDLQTLLCDHIKDAIIAVESRGEEGGRIFVNLSKQNDNYAIEIYDNGLEFDVDTLSKLGLERVTTHADTGGSGIGFVTTFETLRKAYASFIITEFEYKTPFAKLVSFRFDGESAFIIRSYRNEELSINIDRDDFVFET